MSKRYRYTAEEKLRILMEYVNSNISIDKLCKTYLISRPTFYQWRKQYEKHGINGLEASKTWKKYSNELKEAAVLDYLSGSYSLGDIVDKYEISDRSVLRYWIKRYNSHRELKNNR